MSLTKDGLDNIEGCLFEVVHGVEGDCLVLGDENGGTRISGPKPWGGGRIVKRFETQERYGPIERLEAENAKLRELILDMLVDEERGHNDDNTYYEHVRLAKKLGIEVSA